MTDLEFIKKCISEDIHRFYVWRKWRNLNKKIRKDDKNECQICKAKGKYKAAELVHHVKHLKEYPELALSKFYIDENGIKRRNLISVCKDCHETVCHPERMKKNKYKKPVTEERW